MSLRVFWGAALVASLALPLPAATPATADPATEGLSSRERLNALIERVKVAQQDLKSLEAKFVQVKQSEMFLVPQEASGTFSFLAPDRVRWEFASPKPMTVVIDRDKMTTWFRDLNRAEEVTIGRYSEKVFKYLGATGSLETLLQYFDVTAVFPKDPAEAYKLDLAPRFERVAKRLRGMTLWIDRESFMPVRLRYVDPQGDVTEYRFESLRMNAAIPPDRFDLDMPKGVAVERIAG
jgi:outer membrane lipoprotein-sorting protein